jgi:hypothetical protein
MMLWKALGEPSPLSDGCIVAADSVSSTGFMKNSVKNDKILYFTAAPAEIRSFRVRFQAFSQKKSPGRKSGRSVSVAAPTPGLGAKDVSCCGTW